MLRLQLHNSNALILATNLLELFVDEGLMNCGSATIAYEVKEYHTIVYIHVLVCGNQVLWPAPVVLNLAVWLVRARIGQSNIFELSRCQWQLDLLNEPSNCNILDVLQKVCSGLRMNAYTDAWNVTGKAKQNSSTHI